MGLFSRSRRGGSTRPLVAPHVPVLLAEFGGAELEARGRGRNVEDPRFSWDTFHRHVCIPMTEEPLRDRVIQEIYAAAQASPEPELATMGGYLVLAEFDFHMRNPRYLEMLDASLRLMRSRGFSSGHLRRYEADRWIETHGDLRTSFDGLVDVLPPEPDAAPETKTLGLGESRMLAKLGPGELDNQFHAERRNDGSYIVYSLRRRDADAYTIERYSEDQIGAFSSLPELLRALGDYLQSPTFWADDDLAPYFPTRRS